LRDFLTIREHHQELGLRGLSGFLTVADGLALPGDRLPNLFDTLLSDQSAERAYREARPLWGQTGTKLEARRRSFAQRDREKISSHRQLIREGLLGAVPLPGSNYGPRKTWTESALLTNEFGKQKRFAPVRDLLARAAGSILILKPCFMMSPLSLAKFLRPGEISFDLLVIDEASQVRPEDALGGMLRARQLVVVGDAKQLPPTDFFARSAETTSPDDEFEDVDAESILEACHRSFREARRLKWHYRSRCVSVRFEPSG
jgi:superfamily I DNA and/or RNA helicase